MFVGHPTKKSLYCNVDWNKIYEYETILITLTYKITKKKYSSKTLLWSQELFMLDNHPILQKKYEGGGPRRLYWDIIKVFTS